MTQYVNEYTHLTRILSELKEIMQRESKRHEMDEHLTPSMRGLLEDESSQCWMTNSTSITHQMK